MDLKAARELAESLMAQWGLIEKGWTFRFDDAYRRLGACRYSLMTIQLSRRIIPLNEDAEIDDTIRHEIAHALAGKKAGHGPVWQHYARAVGARPQRLAPEWVKLPPLPVLLRCPNGHEVTKALVPKKKKSCGRCSPKFDERYLLKVVNA
jgi:predicted SprT family Zn-dependent metalloprotease